MRLLLLLMFSFVAMFPIVAEAQIAMSRDAIFESLTKVKPQERNFILDDYHGPREKYVYLNINFKCGESVIEPSEREQLRELGITLQRPELRNKLFKCIGHTDSDGPEGLNMDLSKKRAKAVTEFLSTYCFVSAGRLQPIGMGEDQPIAPNDTFTHKRLNRRVEILLVP